MIAGGGRPDTAQHHCHDLGSIKGTQLYNHNEQVLDPGSLIETPGSRGIGYPEGMAIGC